VGQCFHGACGGIWGLIQLHDEHPRAFEASLIRAGVRWRDAGSVDFTWGDCVALVASMSWDDPLFRAMHPDEWMWHNPTHDVLMTMVDLLLQVNAKTPLPDKSMKNKLPKRIERPWDKKPETLRGKSMTFAELDAFLEKRRRGE
jgi:hypothetical protein